MLLSNFKAVGKTQAELHILEVEKLDACINPFSQIWSHTPLSLPDLLEHPTVAKITIHLISFVIAVTSQYTFLQVFIIWLTLLVAMVTKNLYS